MLTSRSQRSSPTAQVGLGLLSSGQGPPRNLSEERLVQQSLALIAADGTQILARQEFTTRTSTLGAQELSDRLFEAEMFLGNAAANLRHEESQLSLAVQQLESDCQGFPLEVADARRQYHEARDAIGNALRGEAAQTQALMQQHREEVNQSRRETSLAATRVDEIGAELVRTSQEMTQAGEQVANLEVSLSIVAAERDLERSAVVLSRRRFQEAEVSEQRQKQQAFAKITEHRVQGVNLERRIAQMEAENAQLHSNVAMLADNAVGDADLRQELRQAVEQAAADRHNKEETSEEASVLRMELANTRLRLEVAEETAREQEDAYEEDWFPEAGGGDEVAWSGFGLPPSGQGPDSLRPTSLTTGSRRTSRL